MRESPWRIYYSIGDCPLCEGNGRVIFARSKPDSFFLVFCDECELTWTSPEQASSTREAGSLKEWAPEGVEFPTLEKLREADLEKYVEVIFRQRNQG